MEKVIYGKKTNHIVLITDVNWIKEIVNCFLIFSSLQTFKWIFLMNRIISFKIAYTLVKDDQTLLDVINKDQQNGLSLFRKDKYPNPEVLISVVQLFQPDKPDQRQDIHELTEQADSDGSRVKFFKSKAKKPDKSKPLSQLYGHNITSGVYVPKAKNNVLFVSGTYVLFANQWFIEVSDTFQQWMPLLPKNLAQIICHEIIMTTDMDSIRTDTSHLTSIHVFPQSTAKSTSSDEPSTQTNSNTVWIIAIALSVMAIVLIAALILWYMSSNGKKKRLKIIKSNKSDSNQSEGSEGSMENLSQQTSAAFETHSATDYSKPIAANNSQVISHSVSEMEKPTDLKIK